METSEFSEWMMLNLKQPLMQLDDDTCKSTTIDKPKMGFRVPPAQKFRGRTLGDYVDKETGKLRPPRYFADRNDHHWFHLLV